MRVSRVKPIALLLLCICGCAGAADDSAIGFKTGEGGLRLKLQPSFIRIPPGNKDQVPLFVDADDIQGHQDQEIEAQGTVRLRRRGQAVYADWLRYDKPEDEVNARGNVRFELRGDVLEGTRLQYKIDTERGAIEKPKYQLRVGATNGRGEGDRIVFEGQGKYRVLGGNYTSCPLDSEDWYLRAKEIDIDKERQIGTVRNASVVFLGAPILYTPYASFSLDRERKSGFLAPTFGSTGNSGYEASIPYYWNIAPNRDATFTPREMSKRGAMLTTEFRYLDPKYSGILSYEVLPQDRVKNDADRYALNLQHNQNWGNGWTGNLNIQKVSDDTYFTDLSTQIAATSQSVLPRSGSLSKTGTWGNDGSWNATALMQHWQTLQTDPSNPITPPYNRDQLSFNAAKLNLGPTDFELASSLVNFTQPTLPEGRRFVAYPSLSLPLQSSFGYVTPKIGVHMTQYEIDQSATTPTTGISRIVPIFSTETGMVFERNTTLAGQGLRQTLEPKIYYVYIPTRNQNQIPVFDSAQQDINTATLYTENQFSGSDRINDANQVTMGVTSRLLQENSGIERLRAALAQRFYFKSQEVTLPGVTPRDSTSSDLLAALSGTVAPHWTADVGWQYTTDTSQTQRANVGTRFQPDPGKVLNLSYRYTSSAINTPSQPVGAPAPTQPVTALRQVDLSGQWPLTGRLSAVARWNYSLVDSRLVEGLAGFEYNGGCWEFRVVAHSFATSSTTSVSSVFVQLQLNGVSNIGSNPLEVLKRNIGGYARQAPQSTGTDDMFPTR